MRDYREKGTGVRDQDPPFQTLGFIWHMAFCISIINPQVFATDLLSFFSVDARLTLTFFLHGQLPQLPWTQ